MSTITRYTVLNRKRDGKPTKNSTYFKTAEKALAEGTKWANFFQDDFGRPNQDYYVARVVLERPSFVKRYLRGLNENIRNNDAAGGIFLMGIFVAIAVLFVGGAMMAFGDPFPMSAFGAPGAIIGLAVFGYTFGGLTYMEDPKDSMLVISHEEIEEPVQTALTLFADAI